MEDKQLVPLIWQAVTLHIGSNSPKKIIPLIHFYQWAPLRVCRIELTNNGPLSLHLIGKLRVGFP